MTFNMASPPRPAARNFWLVTGSGMGRMIGLFTIIRFIFSGVGRVLCDVVEVVSEAKA